MMTTLAVAKSEAATAAVTDRAMTLDEALIFAEFEGDAEAIAELTNVAEDDPDDLTYWAERIRQDRARRTARAALVAEWEAKGVRVVGDDDSYEPLNRLTNAPEDAEERHEIDAEAHSQCAGRAVTPRAWGELAMVEVCTTPEAYQPRYRYAGQPSAVRVPASEQTEEQRDAAEAERRELIANNKAWDAADVLRREFVTTLFQRKTLPKDWALFVAVTTTRFGMLIRNDVNAGVRDLLGVDTDNQFGLHGVAEWVEKNPAKAMHVVLAHAVSAFENAADRNWWRNPSSVGIAYLTQLEAWGYHLTEVEKIAIGQSAAPEADAENITPDVA